jgi:hypothetical protein
LAEDG